MSKLERMIGEYRALLNARGYDKEKVDAMVLAFMYGVAVGHAVTMTVESYKGLVALDVAISGLHQESVPTELKSRKEYPTGDELEEMSEHHVDHFMTKMAITASFDCDGDCSNCSIEHDGDSLKDDAKIAEIIKGGFMGTMGKA